MKITVSGGYLFTAKYFLKASRERRLVEQWNLSVTSPHIDDDELIELQRVCLIDDPYAPADRLVAFLPAVDQLPRELRHLDVTDLIFVDYEYFKLVTAEVHHQKAALQFYLHLISGSVRIYCGGNIIGGIMPLDSVRLLELLRHDQDPDKFTSKQGGCHAH
jgi:hypothetical protein